MATAGNEACEQGAAPVGPGGTCALTPDCAEGYACLPQANGARHCSNDFSSVQFTEDAGLDSTAALPNEAAPPGDATVPPNDGATPPEDTGSSLPDTGSPSADTGAPLQDTGSPPPDAGTPTQDSGAE